MAAVKAEQAATLLAELVSPYNFSPQVDFFFSKKQIYGLNTDPRSHVAVSPRTAAWQSTPQHTAASGQKTARRHVHDHSKLRHKVGSDSGGQHGAPAIERTRARIDGGATMLNAQLVHPGLRPPSISPAISRLSGGCNCNYNCLSDTHRRATASVPSDELHGYY